jgi:hypothetical protein
MRESLPRAFVLFLNIGSWMGSWADSGMSGFIGL